MDQDLQKEFGSSEGYHIPLWIQIIFWGIIVFIALKYWDSSGKYEGQTAEEWFNEYDSAQGDYEDIKNKFEDFVNCVEGYDNMSIAEKLQTGYVLEYCD